MAEVTKQQTDEILEILEHVGVKLILEKREVVKIFAAFAAATLVTNELYFGVIRRKVRKDLEKNRARRESDEVAKRTQVPD